MESLLEGREVAAGKESYLIFLKSVMPKYLTHAEWKNMHLDRELFRNATTAAAEATAVLLVENAWEQCKEYAMLSSEERAQPRKLWKPTIGRKYSTGVGANARANGGWNQEGFSRFNTIYKVVREGRAESRNKDLKGQSSIDTELKVNLIEEGYGGRKRRRVTAEVSPEEDAVAIAAVQADIDDEAAIFFERFGGVPLVGV